MATKAPSSDLLPLLRECKQLDNKRRNSCLSQREHERWLELKDRLGATLAPGERERRQSARFSTRVDVSFETPKEFQEALISNLSLGGVFVSTAFPAEIGTKLMIALRIESTGTRLELPCVVVSQNVGSGFDTSSLGMGLTFSGLGKDQREAVAKLYADAAMLAPKRA